MSIFQKSWVHFLILGVFFFLSKQLFFPTPLPIIGPVSQERMAILINQWEIESGRPPNQQQKEFLVTAELDQEILFRRALDDGLHLIDEFVYNRLLRSMSFLEMDSGMSNDAIFEQALEMQLHQTDELIRRRLVRQLERQLLSQNPPSLPTNEELLSDFRRQEPALKTPARYSIRHIYFPKDRGIEKSAFTSSVDLSGVSFDDVRGVGYPYLSGSQFIDHSLEQLSRQFDDKFVSQLVSKSVRENAWVGPMASSFGDHFVWIDNINQSRDLTFSEAYKDLMTQAMSEREGQVLEMFIQELRNQYEIRL
jgi:hypothetical protein